MVVVAQAFFGFSTWLAAVSISRRPDVERNGQIVDGMWTVCAFDRYVTCRLDESKIADGYSDTLSDGEDDFSTRHDIHRHYRYHSVDFSSGSKGTDQLRRHSCARCFHACRKSACSIPYSSQEKSGKASFLFQANRNMFLRLWGIAVLESFANFSPQLCMYRVLTELERRDAAGGSLDKAVWFWILGLGLAKCAYLAFNGW